MNVDGRFAQNIEYLFCAKYIADIKQIGSDATLAIMLSQGRTLEGHKTMAGHQQNLRVLEQLVRIEQAYTFLKNARGSGMSCHFTHKGVPNTPRPKNM